MPAPVTTLPAGCRIGVLADTHCERDGRRLPAAVFDAFGSVDLIVHLGDCGDPAALDELARLAPVCATRGGDDAAQDGRYADTRVIAAASVTIGALFDPARAGLAVAGGLSAATSSRGGAGLARTFGRSVDVVLFAATHTALVAHSGGVLFVNPGSATLPAPPAPGTVAVLEVRGGVTSVEIVRV